MRRYRDLVILETRGPEPKLQYRLDIPQRGDREATPGQGEPGATVSGSGSDINSAGSSIGSRVEKEERLAGSPGGVCALRKVASGPSGLHVPGRRTIDFDSDPCPNQAARRGRPLRRVLVAGYTSGVAVWACPCRVDVTAVSRSERRAAGHPRPILGHVARGATVMLGELLARFTVQVAGLRVLPPGEGGNPRVESSAQGSGRLLDSEVRISFTSVVVRRADGTLFIVESHGLIMTSEGETVSSTGQGIGRFVNAGLASSWRGAVYFQTASAKLTHLNSVVGVFEQAVDESGKSEIKVFEWK